jgi:HEAT repeat protein
VQGAVPALVLALGDEDEAVRRATAETLGNLRAEATAAIPALQQAVRDRDEGVRNTVILALGKIHSGIQGAILLAG